MNDTIEIFYTGGGITLVETDLNENLYAVLSSDAPQYLTIYNRDEDNEKTYFPDDMVSSEHNDHLTSDLKTLYTKMIEKLKTH